MKQKKIWSMAGCLILLVSACTSGEIEMETAGVARPLEVVAGFDSQTSTKANEPAVSGTNYDKRSFVAEDRIKITKGNNSTGSTYRYNGSRWFPLSANDTLKTTGNESFTATYPTSHTEILANQNSYESFWKSNKLSSTVIATGNRALFTFAPAFAKVTIKVSYKENTTGSSATLTGSNLLSTSGTGQIITLLNVTVSGTSHTYTGIVNPGTSKSLTIKVTTGGSTVKTANPTALTLVAGHEYIFNYSANDFLTLTSVQVIDFTPNNEQDAGSAT